MSELVKLTSRSELPLSGEAKEFLCRDKTICVANINGVFKALDNVCLHRGGPLGQGLIEGDKVVCPWHGWQFDPETGEASHNPKARLDVYDLEIRDNDVMIRQKVVG